jgi:large subunit ribosomal protein L13
MTTPKTTQKKPRTTIAQRVSNQRTLQTVETVRHTVDAKGRPLGRVASEAASALLGKKSVHYVRNFVLPTEVEIVNASKLVIGEKKQLQKEYTRYTGYPGGLRTVNLALLKEKKGIEEVIRKAVDGMIPRNKLRKDRMKRLTITL